MRYDYEGAAIKLHQIKDALKPDQTASLSDVMKNAVIANGIDTVSFNNSSRIGLQHNFSHEIKTGKVTSQEKTGRCWMFAGLNLFRAKVTKALNLDDFEFSQNYTMFYDKLEKANYFLESILRTLEEGIYSRILMWLLSDPLQDGGQWDMFVNLINKYGTIPKSIMPETFHSGNSAQMNQILNSQLRQWAAHLRTKHSEGISIDKLRELKHEYVIDFYRLLCYFLGDPPQNFDFDYRDKTENHKTITDLTPQSFFHNYVGTDLNNYVSLIHSPTPDKPFDKLYTVDYLGNVAEGKQIQYLNVELGVLKQAAIAQIQSGESVWFGCDIRLQTDKKKGLMDSRVFLYENTLETNFSMSKSQRLLYGDSLLTHAMVFTGVHLNNGKVLRWKVENSWGEERGEKGFFVMSDSWFDEYNYQVVVDKKFLPDKYRELLKQELVILPPWDPMGSLAITK